MFEAYTYEKLLEDVLSNAPKDIDTRQGSIFYDAVSGVLLKIAKLYTDLELVLDLSQLDTTEGKYLDLKASEYGITRLSATSAQYKAIFEGKVPQEGERFFTNGQYFTLQNVMNELHFVAEIAGTSGNDIYAGTPAVPLSNLPELTAAMFGEIAEYGNDPESDESLKMRVKEKIAGEAANGNKQHYKTWCESISGVGKARIYPLWNGPNTVKAVLISPLGLPCSERIVAEVQEYIDPATMGYTAEVGGRTYTVGDGLGGGVANLGAHFTAVAAGGLTINVTADVELAAGVSLDNAQKAVEEAIKNHLAELALEAMSTDGIVVRTSTIGALISGVPEIVDYYNLLINGSTENIIPCDDDVPILGEVALNAV